MAVVLFASVAVVVACFALRDNEQDRFGVAIMVTCAAVLALVAAFAAKLVLSPESYSVTLSPAVSAKRRAWHPWASVRWC
jgi:hypothetical protein